MGGEDHRVSLSPRLRNQLPDPPGFGLDPDRPVGSSRDNHLRVAEQRPGQCPPRCRYPLDRGPDHPVAHRFKAGDLDNLVDLGFPAPRPRNPLGPPPTKRRYSSGVSRDRGEAAPAGSRCAAWPPSAPQRCQSRRSSHGLRWLTGSRSSYSSWWISPAPFGPRKP